MLFIPNIHFTFLKEEGGNSLRTVPGGLRPMAKSTREHEMLIIKALWPSPPWIDMPGAETSCRPAPRPSARDQPFC